MFYLLKGREYECFLTTLHSLSLFIVLCGVCIVLLLGLEDLLYKGDFAVYTDRNCLFFYLQDNKESLKGRDEEKSKYLFCPQLVKD